MATLSMRRAHALAYDHGVDELDPAQFALTDRALALLDAAANAQPISYRDHADTAAHAPLASGLLAAALDGQPTIRTR